MDIRDSTRRLLITLQFQLGRFKRCRVEGAEVIVREIEVSIHELQFEIGALDCDRV